MVSAIPGQLSPGATCKGLPGTARRAPCATWPSTPSTSGAQLSCSQRCGDQSGPCSCHPTCFGLASCCVDIRDFCLEISPYSGSMMGGKDFVVRHLNWSNPGTDSVICRWEAPEGARWGPDPLVGWVGAPGLRAGAAGPMCSLRGGWEPRRGSAPAGPACPPSPPLAALRRASRPMAMWTPRAECTACHPCSTSLAASHSRSP